MQKYCSTQSPIILGLCALLLIVNAEVASAMGLIGFKVCIASEMKAKVTSAGKPVAGASVVRKVTFDGKDYVTEVKTDSDGNFVLPTLYERTLWKNTPFEFRILQDVHINHEGTSHLGVHIIRGNFDENGELNNMQEVNKGVDKFVPYEFTCELSDPESDRGVRATHTVLSGKCKTTQELDSNKR